MAEQIFILAGEASGDKFGGKILSEITARGYSPEITGVGGHDMRAFGLNSLFPMEELSIHGIAGAIKHYRKLKKHMTMLVDHIRSTRPRFVLTIDSKAFSLRLGKMLKTAMSKEGWHVPVIHLVAPTVWVWAGWRAKSIPQSVDHLLCLFPFEVPYFTKYGASAIAVGHPAADISWPKSRDARSRLKLDQNEFVVGLFPGSRRREIAGLLPDMCLAIKELRETYPNIKAILPAASTVHDLIEEYLTPEDDIMLVDEDLRYDAMKAADYGLICSGTVTLEAALAGLKGSVYYRTDKLSMLVGTLLVDRSKVILPNAITDIELYELYLGREFTASTMADNIKKNIDGSVQKDMDIADKIKIALNPQKYSGKHGVCFQKSVVDQIERIINGF